jgi:hypothetical protein
MAISIRATGAYVNGTAALTPVIPAGTVAGDIMLCLHGMKPFSATSTINNSWISLGFATNGTVAAGNDVGSMKAQIFYKVHTGTETNPTVTNTANNVSGAVILSFQNDTGSDWGIVGSGGGDATANTTYSATTTSALDVATLDYLIGMIALRSDASTISSRVISGSGITVSILTVAPGTDLSTTAGGDMRMSSMYGIVTGGASTTTLTMTATLSGSQTGSSFIARIREVPASFIPVDPFGMTGFFGI